MDFNGLINGIMPEINRRSEELFAVYRSGEGEWHYEFAPQNEDNRHNWLESIKKQDPLVAVYRGVDFTENRYANVFDKIISQRVFNEYNSGEKSDELYALYKFFEDNTGEFSQKVMDYLAMLDKPLSALSELCPFNMTSDFENCSYNQVLVSDAIAQIDKGVNGSFKGGKPLSHKRNIEGYEEMHGIYVNNHYVFMGRYFTDENNYMIAEFRCDNNHRLLELSFKGVTHDYLEALEKFSQLTEYNISVVKSDRHVRQSIDNVDQLTLTEKHCIQNGLDDEFNSKLIIIKSEVLPPERRTADYQLQVCTGGLGSHSKLRGTAVYCKDIIYGSESRFERHNVLGVADVSKLPKWAKEKYAAFREKGNTLSFIDKLQDSKKKVECDKSRAKEKSTPGKAKNVSAVI